MRIKFFLKHTLRALIGILPFSTGMALANDCQVQISQPVVDYGSFNPHLLRATAKAADTVGVGKRYLQLNVLCADAQPMAISFQGVAFGTDAFQIGDKGHFDLILKDARLDGEPVLLGSVNTPSETPSEGSTSQKLKPGQYLVPLVAHQLTPGKALSVKVEVDTRLRVEQLKIRDVAVLDGQGYFEIN